MSDSKKIKVLHLPYNVSSSPSITVTELNHHSSICARGIIFGSSHHYTTTNGLTYYHFKSRTFGLNLIRSVFILIKQFMWADVIHWYWGSFLPYNIDLKLLKLFRKPIFIQWHGSDIRVPEIVMKDNPFYKASYTSKKYEYYAIENEQQSKDRQLLFSKLNAIPIVYPELTPFVKNSYFKTIVQLRHRIDTSLYKPIYPDATNQKPLIIHISSKEYTKGTNQVREVLAKLSKHLHFDYKIVNNESRENVLKLVEQADIFLDQFIIGEFGLASVEAMTLGKPVVCYIRSEVSKLLPNDFPMINTDLNRLENTLIELIKNADMRHKIGKLSRNYAETYHDSKIVIEQLIAEYKKTVTFK